jgi:hypothetical protein
MPASLSNMRKHISMSDFAFHGSQPVQAKPVVCVGHIPTFQRMYAPHAHAHTHTHRRTHTHTHACAHMDTHIHLHVCIHADAAYGHAHTHTHTHISRPSEYLSCSAPKADRARNSRHQCGQRIYGRVAYRPHALIHPQ